MIQNQLDYFGKEAAQNYLRNNVSLNDFIIKTAADNGLNREQINRVVEAANTTTYLSLFKTAEDKYIEFPVADAEKVAEALNTVQEVPEQLGDYDTPPEKSVMEVNIFPIMEGDLEKEASVNETERLRFYQKAKYADNQLKEKLAALSGTFSEETSSLYNMVKQAVLEGQSFGHIKVAMEQHLPGKITEKILTDLENTLTKSDRIHDLDMSIPEKTAAINKENRLLKKLSDIHNTVEEFTKTADYLKLVGQTIGGGIKSIGSVGNFLIKHPKTSLATAAAGVGSVIGYKSGKTMSDQENSALNTKLTKYKKR